MTSDINDDYSDENLANTIVSVLSKEEGDCRDICSLKVEINQRNDEIEAMKKKIMEMSVKIINLEFEKEKLQNENVKLKDDSIKLKRVVIKLNRIAKVVKNEDTNQPIDSNERQETRKQNKTLPKIVLKDKLPKVNRSFLDIHFSKKKLNNLT